MIYSECCFINVLLIDNLVVCLTRNRFNFLSRILPTCRVATGLQLYQNPKLQCYSARAHAVAHTFGASEWWLTTVLWQSVHRPQFLSSSCCVGSNCLDHSTLKPLRSQPAIIVTDCSSSSSSCTKRAYKFTRTDSRGTSMGEHCTRYTIIAS